MKTEIINSLENPRALEQLYRANKSSFKQDFQAIYPDFKGQLIADCWHERLNFEQEEVHWGSRKELYVVIVVSLLAGLIAKIPHIFSLNEDFFYPRNIGFIIFPVLIGYFAWKNKITIGKIVFTIGVMLVGLVFINLLPDVKNSNTLILSCIHLVLFLWSLLGFTFVGNVNSNEKRLSYLKYNGDLVVITGLILIAGGLLSAITVGLFKLIGLNIEDYYFQNVAIFGLAAAPIVGTYLTQTNPQLVGKVSPVIAKLFSPLVVVMLVAYLTAIVYSGKNPYNDREFLLIFNALLIGVLALIFFSVAETAKSTPSKFQNWVLFILAALTIIVNGVALSAIIFRISEWGITPNRAAVLGGNVLILINLFLVMLKLFKVVSNRDKLISVGQAISSYLPVYVIWTIIVTLIFPLLFGFK